MQFSMLTAVPLPQSERQAYSALPATITLVWRELRGSRPVPLASVADRLSRSSEAGLALGTYAPVVDLCITTCCVLFCGWLHQRCFSKSPVTSSGTDSYPAWDSTHPPHRHSGKCVELLSVEPQSQLHGVMRRPSIGPGSA